VPAATECPDVLCVSDWFEPPEEGTGVEFPRQLAILADCTTIIIITTAHVEGSGSGHLLQ